MKRFYKEVTIDNLPKGFGVALDGRALRSPAKTILHLPSRELAEAVRREWAEAGEEIQPENMPFFSMAVTVIDRVMTQAETLRAELCDYAGNDVLFYRAGTEDAGLDAEQKKYWSPWCDWMGRKFNLEIRTTTGLMPIDQPDALPARVASYLSPLSDWYLGSLYRAVTLSGSFALGLAFSEGEMDAGKLFQIAFLEELHQNKTWGLDSEAEARQKRIEQELQDLERFLGVLET